MRDLRRKYRRVAQHCSNHHYAGPSAVSRFAYHGSAIDAIAEYLEAPFGERKDQPAERSQKIVWDNPKQLYRLQETSSAE